MTNNKILIIAEAGVNHNGSFETAKKLCEVAYESGADMIKFQIFTAEQLVTPDAEKAYYQKQQTVPQENQLQMLKELELSIDEIKKISEYCSELGIEDLYSVFGIEGVKTLLELGKDKVKIPSGEITNGPLLLEVARKGFSVIMSTGMSTLPEVREALSVLAYGYIEDGPPSGRDDFKNNVDNEEIREILQKKVALLHCTTEYPAPVEEANLRAIDTLKNEFGVEVGFSDHTAGIIISAAAVARGSTLIEKHFTLNHNMPGPDHQASLEPEEFKKMVKAIRKVEKSLGDGNKLPTDSELKNRNIVRKSLVASEKIKNGEKFSNRNVTAKRPEQGKSPMEFWELMGKIAKHDYEENELI